MNKLLFGESSSSSRPKTSSEKRRFPKIAELLLPKILPRSSITLINHNGVVPAPRFNLPLSSLAPPPAPLVLNGNGGNDAMSSPREPPQLRQFRRVCSEVVPGELFVSGSMVADDWTALETRGITHVINLACTVTKCPFPDKISYLAIGLADSSSADLEPYLYLCIDFIETALRSKNHRVLVHCVEGVSRSCAVVIGYLMWKRKLSFAEANSFLVAIRPICDPNFGFISQLFQFQARLLKRADAYPVLWRLAVANKTMLIPLRYSKFDPRFVYIQQTSHCEFSIHSHPSKANETGVIWVDRIARIENISSPKISFSSLLDCAPIADLDEEALEFERFFD